MAGKVAVAEILGGKKVLKRDVSSLRDLRDILLEGLPYGAFVVLTGKLRLGREEASRALTISSRTLIRRKTAKRFRVDESDRIARLARITARAIETLGTEEKATDWMRTPNRALGGAVPLYLTSTDIGARQVEEVLARIEHGIFS
ncbi:MAG: antitoxin Xre/MbcA/ParS toxin-binding domain-containing protein [Candidatus Deferrimicrobiaceae bacterium]